jgi:hypothetical protein
MKRIVLLVLFVSFLLSGCRKGEEDPFLSFKSRTNRLCGKWRTVEYTKHIYVGDDPWSYDSYELQLQGGQGTLTYRGSVLDKYSLLEYWEFNKDGTYKLESNAANVISTQEGTWSWNGRNKNSEYKKKECVYLKMLFYNHNHGEEAEEYSGPTLDPSFTMALVKLTDDKITFSSDEAVYEKNVGYQRVQTIATLEKEK